MGMLSNFSEEAKYNEAIDKAHANALYRQSEYPKESFNMDPLKIKILKLDISIPEGTMLYEQVDGAQFASHRDLKVQAFDQDEEYYYFQNTTGSYSVSKKDCRVVK